MVNKVIGPVSYNNLLDRIANILVEARAEVVREINKAQVLAYWEIGREIVEFGQKGKLRAEYGQRLLIKLSEDFTQKFGKGFSVDNLQLMRKFCMVFPGKDKIFRLCLENTRHCLVNLQFRRQCLSNFK